MELNMKNIKNISIIGAGSWGTSIALVIAKTYPQIDVKIWAYEKSAAQSINEKNENIQFLPEIHLPDNIKATNSIKEAVSGSQVILISTPSKVIFDISHKIGKYLDKSAHVGYLSKGFCKIGNEILTISQTIERAVPGLKNRVTAIYGPSHAEEVSNWYHTCLNVAGKNSESRKIISELLSSESIQCRETEDITGVEVGSTLKNPAAIAAGMISVLPKCGDNLSGALMSEALKEMLRLGAALNAKPETIIDISGLGDLVATSLSDHSRNRRFGRDIALQIMKKGKNLSILDRIIVIFKPQMVLEKMSRNLNYLAEGAYAIEPLIELAEKNNISIPVYRSLYEVLLNKKDPSLLIETIKNPDKYEELYKQTKIQIKEKDKGLENIRGYAFKNIITGNILHEFTPVRTDREEEKQEKMIIIDKLKKSLLSQTQKDKLHRLESKIISGLNVKNFEKSLKNLSKLYIKNITDNYNIIFSRSFMYYMKTNGFINYFSGKKGSINITGDIKKIHETTQSANIIYVSTSRELHDYMFICYAINRKKLAFPRFFVNSRAVHSAWEKFLINHAGGFIVDSKRMNNPVYKEVISQYISIMIEHGVPLLYFPECMDFKETNNSENTDDFFNIITDALFRHTVEIVLIPVELSYDSEAVTSEKEKNSIKKQMRRNVNVNFSSPVFMSDFTRHESSANQVSELIKSIWVTDSAQFH